MTNVTYMLLKNKITKRMYESKEEMQTMLDIFFIGERITKDQYQELTDLLNSQHENEENQAS